MAIKAKKSVMAVKHVLIYNHELPHLDNILADWLNQGWEYKDSKFLHLDSITQIATVMYILVKYAPEE